jgi:hypothetical protein
MSSPAGRYLITASGAANIDYSIRYLPGTLTVAPNKRPVAGNDSVTTTKNTAVTIKVLANDRDADGFLILASVAIVS